MKKLLLVMFLVLYATVAFSAIYRSSTDDDAKRGRRAVTFIDMGHLKDDAFTLEYFSLVCVDGVKIYTITSRTGVSVQSFILPGNCDGTIDEPKQQLRQPKQLQPKKKEQPVTNQNGMVSW